MKITGKTIHLRDLELKDLPVVYYWLHPDHEWHKFDGPYYPKTPADKLPETIARWSERIARAAWTTPRGRMAIANADDLILGMVTRYWISEETNWLATGISIWNPDDWGNGYGYEALGLWCNHLFEADPSFVRLSADTWSGNHGMMKLAEKLGFIREATFRKARIVNGDYYDGIGYGILREEWAERYPDGFAASL